MTQTKATSSIPYNTAGTINIHVNNPTANAPTMPQYGMPMMPYPAFCYPPSYYMGSMVPPGINQVTNINTQGLTGPATYTQQHPGLGTGSADARATATAPTTTEKKKEREIVVLTDNYIKNLENYLRNNNVELRKEAIKEVLLRFKEDKSRFNNPSLTALMNLALQDPNASVRAVAMSITGSGYAQGDATTQKLLEGLQTSKLAYRQDATQASDSLLEMSKTKVLVPDNSFYPEEPPKKKKGVS